MSHPSTTAVFNAVSAAYGSDIAFRLRLRYQGTTANGNPSDKWWELTFAPEGSGNRARYTLLCNHGKTGSAGRAVPHVYDYSKAMKKLEEKLHSGYRHESSDLAALAPKGLPLPPPFDKVDAVYRVPNGDRMVWNAYGADHVLIASLSLSGALKLQEMLIELSKTQDVPTVFHPDLPSNYA